MAEQLHTTRRAVLSGLAAMPLATLPALAQDDAQARYRHHLDGLKQAIRDLSPTKVYFNNSLLESDFSALVVVRGTVPA